MKKSKIVLSGLLLCSSAFSTYAGFTEDTLYPWNHKRKARVVQLAEQTRSYGNDLAETAQRIYGLQHKIDQQFARHPRWKEKFLELLENDGSPVMRAIKERLDRNDNIDHDVNLSTLLLEGTSTAVTSYFVHNAIKAMVQSFAIKSGSMIFDNFALSISEEVLDANLADLGLSSSEVLGMSLETTEVVIPDFLITIGSTAGGLAVGGVVLIATDALVSSVTGALHRTDYRKSAQCFGEVRIDFKYYTMVADTIENSLRNISSKLDMYEDEPEMEKLFEKHFILDLQTMVSDMSNITKNDATILLTEQDQRNESFIAEDHYFETDNNVLCEDVLPGYQYESDSNEINSNEIDSNEIDSNEI